MISAFHIKNFKSFVNCLIPLTRLTFLIGANASGKSNFLEALRLLNRLATGQRLDDLERDIKKKRLEIRGSINNLFLNDKKPIALGCELNIALKGCYCLDLQIGNARSGLELVGEKLAAKDANVLLYDAKICEKPETFILDRDAIDSGISETLGARFADKTVIPCSSQQAVFYQLESPALFKCENEMRTGLPPILNAFRANLRDIFFLEPDPGAMRDYSAAGDDELQESGDNISSVLKTICEDKEKKEHLLEFIRSLPEQDIKDISFITTERNDVMLRLDETFGGKTRKVDAPLLSDGTLRVLAVAAILLSAPQNSLVVIEEVDNGIHPSRAEILIQNIQNTASERDLQVLVTTHNPSLMDAVPDASLEHVLCCYREQPSGESKIIRLGDIGRFPQLMAHGSMGTLMASNLIDRFIKDKKTDEQRQKEAFAWLEDLQKAVAS